MAVLEGGSVERARGSRPRGRPSCRDGATTSAPARAWETASAASSGSVASLSTWPSCRTPQCAVRRVLAEANVGQHRESRRLGPGSRGSRSVPDRRRPRRKTLLILAIRQAEQQHPAHPTGLGLGRQGRGHVGGDVPLAGERRDRPVDARAAHDEERLNQVCRGDARLAHEPAQPLGTSQSAHANSGETHTAKRRCRARLGRCSAPIPIDRVGLPPLETVYARTPHNAPVPT